MNIIFLWVKSPPGWPGHIGNVAWRVKLDGKEMHRSTGVLAVGGFGFVQHVPNGPLGRRNISFGRVRVEPMKRVVINARAA